jgi:hypothetical protein
MPREAIAVGIYHASSKEFLGEALARIAALYAIEAGIRGCAVEQRLAIRQAQSAPFVADLEAWLTAVLEQMVSGKVNSRRLASLLPWAWRHVKRAELAA